MKAVTFSIFFFVCPFFTDSELYPYFTEEVVKLVDYVNQLHWIDISVPSAIAGDAKVNIVRKRAELLLPINSNVSYEVSSGQKYVIIKSTCMTTSGMKIMYQTVNEQPGQSSVGLPLSLTSCINNTWLYVSTTAQAEEAKLLIVSNEGTDDISIQRLGVGTSSIEKTLGVVHEDGRKRLELLKSFSNSQIIVSVLGLRGSGKSTIASLLSGNDEMFRAGRRSKGTTTLGIDLSPIIPISDYIPSITNRLSRNFSVEGAQPIPILLTDSEGMGVRGEDIDFVASVPPLLLSNIIMWITTDSLRVDEELKKLDKYLNLANKICDESGSLCTDFRAGHLIVVVNKMQGDESDQELTEELVEEEEGSSDSISYRNSVRQNLVMCFQSVQVIGFPYLNVPNDESFIKYEYITGSKGVRFTESLSKIVSLILQAREERRVLAGTILTPKEIPAILDATLEKINTGAEFFDNELRDILFTLGVREKLNQYELMVMSKVSDAERQETMKLFVSAIHQIFQNHDVYKSSFLAEGQNSRQLDLLNKEWTIVEARLLKFIQKSVFSLVGSTVNNTMSSLVGFSSNCAFASAETHRCIQKKFLAGLRETLVTLPKLLVEDSVATLENAVNGGMEILGDCREARRSFLYSELSKSVDLAGMGVSLEEKLDSGATIDEIRTWFDKLRNVLFPVQTVKAEYPFYCSPSLGEGRPVISVSSSFYKSVEVARNHLSFNRRQRPLDVAFDFLNDLQKVVTVGSTMRVIDSTCDLPSIIAGVPHSVSELNIHCLRTVAYGRIVTHLKMLRIDTVRLEVNPNGATVRFAEAPPPAKTPHHVPGGAGSDAGSVFVKVRSLVTGGVLEVQANGGQGGPGGDGVHGGQGAPGPSGSVPGQLMTKEYYDGLGNGALSQTGYQEHECKKRGKWWKKKKGYTCGRTWTYSQYFVHRSTGSGAGGQGQPGTNGAPGGPGGKPGTMLVEADPAWNKHFKLSAVGGMGGTGGQGGEGGPGGIGGVTHVLEITYSRVWQWWENQGEKMISSGMHGGMKESGREGNGPQGRRGEPGPPGASGGPPNAIIFRTLNNDLSVFSYLEQIPSAEMPESKCGLHFDGRNLPNSAAFINSNVELLSQQKALVAGAKSLYSHQTAGAVIQTHATKQLEFVSKLTQTYSGYKENLQKDMNSHVNILSAVEKELSKLSLQHFEGLIDRIGEELSVKVVSGESAPSHKFVDTLADTISRVFTVINLAVGSMAIKSDSQNEIKGVFRSARSFWEKVQKAPGYTMVKMVNPGYNSDLLLKGCDSFPYDHAAFNKLISIGEKENPQNIREPLQGLVNSLASCSTKDYIVLGIRFFDLLKAHTLKSVNDGQFLRYKRRESYQLLAYLQSAALRVSDSVVSYNLQEMMRLVQSLVYNSKKLAAVQKDIGRIDAMLQIFGQRKGAFEGVRNNPAIHSAFPIAMIDQMVTHSAQCLLDIGRELRWRLFSFAGVVSCAKSEGKFLESLESLAPWSSPTSFSNVFEILKRELAISKGLHQRTISHVLDEIERPFEFGLLRAKGKAIFLVYSSDRNPVWIEDIRTTLRNASGDLRPGTVVVRHLGMRLYPFDDDICLPPVAFQSKFRLPGPTREDSLKPNLGDALDPSYFLDSYYEIELRDMTDVRDIVQIELQFFVRSEPNPNA